MTLALPTARTSSLANTAIYGNIIFDLTGFANVSTVKLPSAAIMQFANDDLAVQFHFTHGVVILNADAVADMGYQANTENITVRIKQVSDLTDAQQGALVGDFDVFSVTIMSGDYPITNFDGVISVNLPYDGELPVTVWLINEDGEKIRIGVIFDDEYNLVTFATDIIGIFAVGIDYNENKAIDDEVPTLILRFVIGLPIYMHHGIQRISDVNPFITGNRAMVPLRIIAEALGATVYWDGENRAVDITLGDMSLRLYIDVPLPDGMGTPVIVNGRTFVPTRYVSEMLGALVRWDPEHSAVYVYQQ